MTKLYMCVMMDEFGTDEQVWFFLLDTDVSASDGVQRWRDQWVRDQIESELHCLFEDVPASQDFWDQRIVDVRQLCDLEHVDLFPVDLEAWELVSGVESDVDVSVLQEVVDSDWQMRCRIMDCFDVDDPFFPAENVLDIPLVQELMDINFVPENLNKELEVL